jgi:hypothetical protein
MLVLYVLYPAACCRVFVRTSYHTVYIAWLIYALIFVTMAQLHKWTSSVADSLAAVLATLLVGRLA